MKDAVQVTYDQSSMRLLGKVVDSGTTLSFAVSEYCSPGRGDNECYIDLLDTNTPDDEVLEKWSLICPNEETEVPSLSLFPSSVPSSVPSLSLVPSVTPSISPSETHCNGKTTLIASEYSDFDDSSRSFCMHVFNIPRTLSQYKKMAMRPCYDPDSLMKKREWLVDSGGKRG
eukprot:scaffold3739_cov166-Chaetoceros_neogracile.AAC.1